MPTDLPTPHPFTSSAVRTKTGTEVHRAFVGSSRTDCGCRVYSGLSRDQMFAAQAAGSLCEKCWPAVAQTDTPAEWVERCAGIDERIAAIRAEGAAIVAAREVQA